MTPPVLVDLTSDGVEDIVIPMFNSSLLAIDGLTFKTLWNHTFPMSESYRYPSDLSLCVRKPTICVPTRSDTNWAGRPQKMTRGWKFWV